MSFMTAAARSPFGGCRTPWAGRALFAGAVRCGAVRARRAGTHAPAEEHQDRLRGLRRPHFYAGLTAQTRGAAFRLAAEGQLTRYTGATFPLAETAGAVADIESRATTGKPLLVAATDQTEARQLPICRPDRAAQVRPQPRRPITSQRRLRSVAQARTGGFRGGGHVGQLGKAQISRRRGRQRGFAAYARPSGSQGAIK
jgi:hypothetical protein